MSTASKQTLSTADLAWLRVQSPENPAATTIGMFSPKPLDEACLKSRIEDRLLAQPRFRQRIESPYMSWARPRWIEHDEFQLADHFIRIDLRDATGSEELDGLLSELRSQPLEDTLPLWQVHLVRMADGGSALILRVHAAVADAKSALDLALQLTDEADQPEQPTTALGLEHVIPPHKILEATDRGTSSTRALCRLISSRSDRENPLRRQPTGAKSLAWSEPVNLEILDKQATRCKASPTEVLITGITGALRTAIHSKDVPTEDVGLRAVVPLSLRAGERPAVGTRMALGLLRLPLSGSTPGDRLTGVQASIERLQLAAKQMAVLGPDARQGLSMTEFEERSLRLLGKKATVALALADGPAKTVTLCDQPVTHLLWWPNELGEISLGISILGYAGTARFCVTSDDSLELDTHTLAADMTDACGAI